MPCLALVLALQRWPCYFREHGAFETYMNIDERSAGFMALIRPSKACNSRVHHRLQRVAHYMPAVLEAQYSGTLDWYFIPRSTSYIATCRGSTDGGPTKTIRYSR